jgi:hypothetical protein
MPRSNRGAGGDDRLRPYRDGGRDQLWPPDDARRFYAVRSRMMHDIRAACAAQRPTPWDAGGGLPVDAGYQGLAPNEETILRAVLFTFQPPGARQPRARGQRAGGTTALGGGGAREAGGYARGRHNNNSNSINNNNSNLHNNNNHSARGRRRR